MISPALMESAMLASNHVSSTPEAGNNTLPKILNVRGGLSPVGIELRLLNLADVYELDPNMVQLEKTRQTSLKDLQIGEKGKLRPATLLRSVVRDDSAVPAAAANMIR